MSLKSVAEKRASHDIFIEKVAARVLEKIAISIVGSGPAQQPGFFSNLMSGLGNFFRPSSAIAAGSAPVQQAAGGFASKDYLARQSQAKMDALGYRSGRLGANRNSNQNPTAGAQQQNKTQAGATAQAPPSAQVQPQTVAIPQHLIKSRPGAVPPQFAVNQPQKAYNQPFPVPQPSSAPVPLPHVSRGKSVKPGEGYSHLFQVPTQAPGPVQSDAPAVDPQSVLGRDIGKMQYYKPGIADAFFGRPS